MNKDELMILLDEFDTLLKIVGALPLSAFKEACEFSGCSEDKAFEIIEKYANITQE